MKDFLRYCFFILYKWYEPQRMMFLPEMWSASMLILVHTLYYGALIFPILAITHMGISRPVYLTIPILLIPVHIIWVYNKSNYKGIIAEYENKEIKKSRNIYAWLYIIGSPILFLSIFIGLIIYAISKNS